MKNKKAQQPTNDKDHCYDVQKRIHGIKVYTT